MQYIDWNSATIPTEWNSKANSLLQDMKKCATDAERKKIINSNSIWSELKPIMAALSSRKCWYCETKSIRFTYHVDHFRPKKRVTKAKGHSGYWWLAFDWRNFRYSCEFCNARRSDEETNEILGKGNYFPLYDEKKRCMDIKGSISIDDETPLLLDPTVESDTQLIWFEETGKVVVNPTFENDAIAKKKVESSDIHYALRHSGLVRARKKLANDLKALVDEGNDYYAQIQKSVQLDENQERLNKVKQILRDLIDPTAELASAAQAYLQGLFDESSENWLIDVFITPSDVDEISEDLLNE